MFSRQFGAVKTAAIVLLLASVLSPAAAFAQPGSVQIEELTSTELRDRIAGGATTVLIPIGGTEQSGSYIALGKHNVRARVLAGEIAQRLGNAVVAPVISYVPEGSITPPAGHMRFAGTISIPQAAFESVLEGAARSFKQHGFRHVFFLGDHGGYQNSETRVAERLNREWARDPSCRVHALLAYYRVTQGPYVAALEQRGYSQGEIGTHAGLADTSLAMAVDQSLVRGVMVKERTQPGEQQGVQGDPRRASAELGRLGVQQIVDTSVAAIRKLTVPKP